MKSHASLSLCFELCYKVRKAHTEPSSEFVTDLFHLDKSVSQKRNYANSSVGQNCCKNQINGNNLHLLSFWFHSNLKFCEKIHMDEVLYNTSIMIQYKTKSPIIDPQSPVHLNDFTKTPPCPATEPGSCTLLTNIFSLVQHEQKSLDSITPLSCCHNCTTCARGWILWKLQQLRYVLQPQGWQWSCTHQLFSTLILVTSYRTPGPSFSHLTFQSAETSPVNQDCW